MTTSARAQNAWALIFRGMSGIVLGVLAFGLPVVTIAVLCTLFGLYALTDGAVAVAAASRVDGRDMRSSPLLAEGMLGVIAGAAALLIPVVTALALAMIVAAWSIGAGVLRIAGAVCMRQREPYEWLLTLSGAAGVALGLIVLRNPDVGSDGVLSALGAYAAVVGVMLAVCGLRVRRRESALKAL
jgi:uncharacterized membrane protein HdeD (DUF308 family)